MIIHVTNIEWDTDENDIPSESLPSEVDLCTSFLRDIEDSICENLEERYGYCVKNLAIDI